VEIGRYLAIGAFALVLLVGGAAALQEPKYGDSSNAGATDNSVRSQLPVIAHPVTLNTVPYAEQVIRDKLLLPDLSPLGPGYQIVGVQINRPPTKDTTSGGIAFRHWILAFFITNQRFVNGSTLNTDLYSSAIEIAESNTIPGTNSHDEAERFIGSGQSCVVSFAAQVSSTSCTSHGNTVENLVQIRNTYLVVEPTGPSALFWIGGADRAVSIYGAHNNGILSYQKLLALAGSIIP